MAPARRLLHGLRAWWDALLAPADDPRETFADVIGRQQRLLREVAAARAGIGAARARLEAQVAAGREKLAALEERARAGAASDDVATLTRQLQRHAAEEIHALESELRELRQDESLLPLIEDRIDSEIGALQARQEVLAARSSSAAAQVHVQQAMTGMAGEIDGLMQALHHAEQRTERLQARATAFDRLLELGLPPRSTGERDDLAVRRLSLRFAFEADHAQRAACRPSLRAGLRTLHALAQAYDGLQPVLAQRGVTDPLALSRLPALIDETYQQGVRALEAALDLLLAGCQAPDPAGDAVPDADRRTASDPAGAADLIAQADRCRSVLQQARTDIAAMRASQSESRLDAVTEALRDALQRARAVQRAIAGDPRAVQWPAGSEPLLTTPRAHERNES